MVKDVWIFQWQLLGRKPHEIVGVPRKLVSISRTPCEAAHEADPRNAESS